jgi:succinate dehydrogenase / fumarate reductase, membrane anchor subunit
MGNGTSIGKVRGLGSAAHGSQHWLVQRFTAAGNFLGGLFLAVTFIALPDMSYETLSAWFAKPFPATVVALFAVSVFWHARLGLQVLLEDYVHTAANKYALLLLLNLATFLGAAFAVLSVVSLVTNQPSLTQADVQNQITQTLQGMMGGAGGPQ